MKVLLVNGSPHKEGCTYTALTEVANALDRVFYADFCGGRNNFYLNPAAAVMSARRAGATAAWDQMNKYFGLMQMPSINSRYWNMVHGAKPEDVVKDEEGMQVMRILGKNTAWFLKCKPGAGKQIISSVCLAISAQKQAKLPYF